MIIRAIDAVRRDVVSDAALARMKNARLEIERKTGRKVVSSLNASDTGALEVNLGDTPPLPSP